ncbi:MAG TPA: Crp/Fnr family transcriptional regulator [Cytophagaceae bacterium]|jgi:CRP/FNR family transcriptional regulator
MDDNFILLRNHKLFQQLTLEECKDLNITSGFIEAKKNDFIYLNNFVSQRLFFLKKGYIKIGHYDESGQEVISEILQQGDIFGQISLNPEKDNEEFAQAIKTDASMCSFTIQDFENILERRSDLAISFTKLVGLKFRSLQNRYHNIINKDVRHRLKDFLLYLSDSNNARGSNEVVINNFLTHADIAGLIGSTRQTVTTLLKEISEKDLIRFDRKQIIFPDMDTFKQKFP